MYTISRSGLRMKSYWSTDGRSFDSAPALLSLQKLVIYPPFDETLNWLDRCQSECTIRSDQQADISTVEHCPVSEKYSACTIPVRHNTLCDGDAVSDPISCYGNRQTVPCLTITTYTRFLSDTTHCPMVTLKSVCRTKLSDPISCYGNRQTLAPSDTVLCLTRIMAHARFLSDTTHCPMVTLNHSVV